MRRVLATVGTAVAAVLSCLAISVTAGFVGLSDLAAFGANLGVAAILASALMLVWIVRLKSRSGDRHG